jgi:hypothetical protein
VSSPRASSERTPAHRIPDVVIADLVDRLAMRAEAVCRRYLSNGRREGAYWRVGDLANTPGRSLFVRLKSGAKGPAGKWTDAQSGEHGDLLDIIRATRGLRSFPDVVAEARAFLGLPDENARHDRRHARSRGHRQRTPAVVRDIPHRAADSSERDAQATTPEDDGSTLAENINAARRLFMASIPIAGTLAELYLRRRRITALDGLTALRFHPACLYRDGAVEASSDYAEASAISGGTRESQPSLRGPALIAAITDADGWITGVQRTWLDAEALLSDRPLGDRLGKAGLLDARRSLGLIAGGVVRLPPLIDDCDTGILLVGEGVETVLSLRAAMPSLPMAAALSAGQLAGFALPVGLRRLLIAEDADPAGRAAAAALATGAAAADVEVVVLMPQRGDFNDDFRLDGVDRLLARIRAQLGIRGCADLCAAMS